MFTGVTYGLNKNNILLLCYDTGISKNLSYKQKFGNYYFTRTWTYSAISEKYRAQNGSLEFKENIALSGYGLSYDSWNLFLDVDNKNIIRKDLKTFSYEYSKNSHHHKFIFDKNLKPQTIKDKPHSSLTLQQETETAEKIFDVACKMHKTLYRQIVNKKNFKEQVVATFQDICRSTPKNDYMFIKERAKKAEIFFKNYNYYEQNIEKYEKFHSVDYFLSQYPEFAQKKYSFDITLIIQNVLYRDCIYPNIYSKNINFLKDAKGDIEDEIKAAELQTFLENCTIDELCKKFCINLKIFKDKEDFISKLEEIINKAKNTGFYSLLPQEINQFIQYYISRENNEQLLLDFTEKYHSTKYIFELSDEKEKLFKQYQKNHIPLSKELSKEYDLYIELVAHFHNLLYSSRTNQTKPFFKKIPDYIKYFEEILSYCVDTNILQYDKEKDEYIFQSFRHVKDFFKLIKQQDDKRKQNLHNKKTSTKKTQN